LFCFAFCRVSFRRKKKEETPAPAAVKKEEVKPPPKEEKKVRTRLHAVASVVDEIHASELTLSFYSLFPLCLISSLSGSHPKGRCHPYQAAYSR
jgi:hypothetical protein